MKHTKETLKVGQTVTYNVPAIPLISSAGVAKGVIKVLGNKGLTVTDAEIEPGEDMKYDRHIGYSQIIQVIQ